mmetsp:Transcript_11308/g.24416  ORF Transcript_11308/g.24416 Transcript_11308/m.24416 type:complete len:345 (+) Transcript_11308:208-1242(+)
MWNKLLLGIVCVSIGNVASLTSSIGFVSFSPQNAAYTARSVLPMAVLSPEVSSSHDVTTGRPLIEWYPGHIAKAERMMGDVLAMVDVVVELRDARIPRSTAHPLLSEWVGTRGHVLALNRMDSAPEGALREWEEALRAEGKVPCFVDGKQGTGVRELKQAILEAGRHVNERRKRRGINSRPVRAAILGYPNVGKSAIINRLVNRKKAKSENRPGVTRGFTWIRIDAQVQLLDSPGIIPAKQVTQAAAYHLAMCDDIGSAAYDVQSVAAALLEKLLLVSESAPNYVRLKTLRERWGVDVECSCGEEYLRSLADQRFTGDMQRAAVTLLKDFRSGLLGRMCLEPPR